MSRSPLGATAPRLSRSIAFEPEAAKEPALRIRLFGSMTIVRSGESQPLPRSRKVRALLAYLALSMRPVSRGQLCDLMWDAAEDPRGELRWCLSKLRRVLDEPHRRRVIANADAVALDLSDCSVDVAEIARAMRQGCSSLDLQQLRTLSQLFAGELLEDAELDDSPQFAAWLIAERHRLREHRIELVAQLVQRTTGAEALAHLQEWLRAAPFDLKVHELLFAQLARSSRIVEGDEQLEASVRRFEDEGLSAAALRAAWRNAKMQWSAAAGARGVQDGQQPVMGATTFSRASIAVLPFEAGQLDPGGCADGFVHDIITLLAKLRGLFVIAPGAVFALRERGLPAAQTGRLLNVEYIVTGSLRRQGSRLRLAVELVEVRSERVVWAETFDQQLDDGCVVLDEIARRIVGAVASEIELNEQNRAIAKPPESLDAWEAYHRGLWHMYRFQKAHNERASQFFRRSISLDPTFARAHAGLSFTHFQNAFQRWASAAEEVELAFEAAGRSVMTDDRDPAAHWAMGRALWLRGMSESSVVELERAVDLSPNFAHGHYALAFVRSQSGDACSAIHSADEARELSPCDPMQYAMLATRAMALVRLQRFDEAARWAVKAAARPNAHPHVQAIGSFSAALAGALDEARARADAIRRALPHYGLADFFSAFKFDDEGAALFRKGAALVQMS